MTMALCRVYLPENLFWAKESRLNRLFGAFEEIADRNYCVFYVTHASDRERDGHPTVTEIGSIRSRSKKITHHGPYLTFSIAGDHAHLDGIHLPGQQSGRAQSIQIILYSTTSFYNLGNSIAGNEAGSEFIKLAQLTKVHVESKSDSNIVRHLDKVVASSKPLLAGCFTVIQKLLVPFNWIFKNTAMAQHFREWKRVFADGPLKKGQLWTLAWDVLLGLLIMVCLGQMQSPGQYIMTVTNDIVHHLHKLLESLRGSPVGLKVNMQLNDFLLNCFIYHVNLWRTFLFIVSPAINHLVILMAVLGCCGLSFQLAMLSDLLIVITIHAHCFYIYAAVLYRLEIVGLKALWRVVLGRRKNVLKDRVEAYNYDHQQLFLATLFFASLLFLLPTVLVYYVVFATLRLGTYCITYLLLMVRRKILQLPVQAIVRWLIGTHLSADNVTLEFVKIRDADSSVTVVRAQPNASTRWKAAGNETDLFAGNDNLTVTQFIGDLIRGEIKGFVHPQKRKIGVARSEPSNKGQ